MRFCDGTLGCFISHSGIFGQWELRIHGDDAEANLLPLDEGRIRIGKMSPRALRSSMNPAGFKHSRRALALLFTESIRSGGATVPLVSDLNYHARTMIL